MQKQYICARGGCWAAYALVMAPEVRAWLHDLRRRPVHVLAVSAAGVLCAFCCVMDALPELDIRHDDLAIVIHKGGQGRPGNKQQTWDAVTGAAPRGIYFG
jgi:hypothetical protein